MRHHQTITCWLVDCSDDRESVFIEPQLAWSTCPCVVPTSPCVWHPGPGNVALPEPDTEAERRNGIEENFIPIIGFIIEATCFSYKFYGCCCVLGGWRERIRHVMQFHHPGSNMGQVRFEWTYIVVTWDFVWVLRGQRTGYWRSERTSSRKK